MQYEYNNNLKNTKYSLIKKAIKGLSAVGILTLSLTACGVDKNFEYDQSKQSTLSEQYQEYIDKDLPSKINTQLNSLRPYEISFDEYNDILSVNAKKEEQVSARIDVISDSKALVNAAKAIIEIKAKEKLNLSEKAEFEFVDNGNSKDGPYYIINISDGDKSYIINNPSGKIYKMMNLIFIIESYKGNGNSKSWDKAIEGYVEYTEELYYSILDIASDSSVEIKAKEVKNDTKTKR